jgi:predicted nuclease of predicted toxin-antitoxin system
MPKGFYKHKLLLDENMPLRSDFPNLNSKFDVKHLADDFRQGGLADHEVYQLAVDQNRILVTYNSKHFRNLAGSRNDAGIIGVSARLASSQVDTKLTALLTRSTPHALEKKFTPLTGETDR